MQDENRKKIKEIMAGIHCKKNFQCAESGFKNLCSAEDIGQEEFLKCLEKNPSVCSFEMPFGSVHFCQCPLRVYLSTKVKK